jgi:prepilin-type N-terminal cleavage/methylation domain-containing protein
MNKKGFTLIELLAAIVIIALLSGIGVVSYRTIFKTAEERYFNVIESNMLLAGNDYFEDHRSELPLGSEYKEVTLATLTDSKYIEDVKDPDGNICTTGSVFAYRENNKFKYEACLQCGDYESKGRFCSTVATRVIEIHSKKVGSSTYDYDVLKSFGRQTYSNNKNILVYFSMAEEYHIDRYEVTDIRDNTNQTGCNAANGACNVEIGRTGTYLVKAYDKDNNEVSSRYINVKIARDGSNFRLEGDTEYLISKNECSGGTTTKEVTINIIPETNEEYKKIEYQINGGETEEIIGKVFTQTLESGHYDIDIIVTNYANNVSVRRLSVNIPYYVNVEYGDGDTSTTHKVVKGEIYNYLSSLPVTKVSNGETLPIRWYKDGEQIDPTEEIVEEVCTHTIIGRTKQTCQPPTNVNVTKDGIVSWTPSSNCPTAQHQVSLDGVNWTNATSGTTSIKTSLIASAGEKTVYFRTASPNANYDTSDSVTKKVNVYSVTLTKGTGISAVTGAGNYISGSTVTLGATVSTGYSWSKWTNTSSGAQVSTTNAYSTTISSNLAYTAITTSNISTVNLDANGGTGGTSVIYEKYNSGWYSNSNGTTSITSITPPTLTGYSFGGYYLSSDTNFTGTQWIDSSGVIKVNATTTTLSSVTLKAKWTANSYTLTYNDNLFAAQTQSKNGVVVTYTDNGSYLTINGTPT